MNRLYGLADDLQREIGLRVLKAALLALLLAVHSPAEAQVTDLHAVEAGSNVELSWTTGTGPYRVLRSSSPDFFFGNHVVSPPPATSPEVDAGAASASNQSSFYQVFVVAEADPRGFSVNPPPAVPPTLTSLNPESGPPGTVVTITGTGFATNGTLVTSSFAHFLADTTVIGATQVQAVVPEGAFSGDVRVCILSDACSNALLFRVTIGPTFQDLSSISFESGTGSLWVADRGSADDVYEIDSTGAVLARGAIAQPIVAHPSPTSGTGRIYFSNSTDSIGNQGTIRYVNSSTNADVGFKAAGGGAGDWVRCEGMAANDSQPTTAYFLDGVDNTVRRVIDGPPTNDNNYGNTNLLVFNRPAGARFDSSGNLYVTSTTTIYKITPAEVVSAVGSMFTAAAGLDLFETAGGPMLVVADEATGEVYLVNPQAGTRSLVFSGLSGPVGVALTNDTGDVGTALYVAEPTRIVRVPDPRIVFVDPIQPSVTALKDERILLSKDQLNDVYPSTAQVADGQIRVRVRLNPLIDPTGLSAHFRITDPADPSGYIVGASEDDNIPSSPGASISAQVPFDASGLASATLVVEETDVSGNNFRVEASLEGGGAFRPIATSPVYTSWRRIYVEHDNMLKVGAWIRQTTTAGLPTPTEVQLSSSASFAVNDDVWVLSGDSFATAMGELGVVTEVGTSPDYVKIDTDPGPGTRGLIESYTGNLSDNSAPFGFVGKLSGEVYGGALSFSNLSVAFGDAFTDWRVLQMGAFVPLWTPVPPIDGGAGAYLVERGPLFFNVKSDPNSLLPLNTIHLISAAEAEDALGLTQFDPDVTQSWVMHQGIDDTFPDLDVPDATENILAHELTHLFHVNQGDPGNRGHDARDAWLGGGKCLMNEMRDRTLGVVKLHEPTLAPTQDLMCIRTHVDALNSNNSCLIP